jgi:hypothetical protein
VCVCVSCVYVTRLSPFPSLFSMTRSITTAERHTHKITSSSPIIPPTQPTMTSFYLF